MFGDNFGARKKSKKKNRRKARKARGCHTGMVTFKTKRGKTVKFRGRTGDKCGPRKKAYSTAHLRKYKPMMGKAARSCKGKKGSNFRACVRTKMKAMIKASKHA